MIKYLKIIRDFLENNRLFTVIMLMFLFVTILLITNAPKGSNTADQQQDLTTYWYQTKDFTVYKTGNQIIVTTTDPALTNPTIIKNTLGIPQDQEIVVLVDTPDFSGQTTSPQVTIAPDFTVTPTPTMPPGYGN